MSAQLKPKRCRVCRAEFMPRTSFAVACSPKCALEYGKRRAQTRAKRKAQQERAERRVERERIKTPRELTKEAQRHFNAWIRWRDRFMPCISCGTLTPPPRGSGGAWDAGHYRSVGAAPELRFSELNCHRQCKTCNAGSAKFASKGETVRVEYRRRLIARIGLEHVEWLEGPHPPQKYTAEELRNTRDYYRQLLREAKKQ